MRSALCLIAAVFLSFFFLSPASPAQEQYGNLRGVVADKDGAPLPGVSLVLEAAKYGVRTAVTSEAGIFRFINITPSIYTLKCELPGFKTYLQENLDIRVGSNFDLRIVMELAVLQEEVTVKAASPVVDTKKTSVGVNVTQEALQEIPSARDPWVILQQVPGILMVEENVGGSNSGIQTLFYSKGTDYESAMWNMDGIPITDRTSMGSSFYYDFDSFEEMNITTGGQDATVQIPGVSINFVTRRGGNRFQGMARFYFANDDLQADKRTEELEGLGYMGDRIVQMLDYGFQLGGPILKDKLWFWLGFGVQDSRRLTITGYPIQYQLYNYNAKLNVQLSSKNRAELARHLEKLEKEGERSVEGVQIFTPTPMTRTTCMYHTGIDPVTGSPLTSRAHLPRRKRRNGCSGPSVRSESVSNEAGRGGQGPTGPGQLPTKNSGRSGWLDGFLLFFPRRVILRS